MSSLAIWDTAKASASWESELAARDCITDLSWVPKAFLIFFVYLAIVERTLLLHTGLGSDPLLQSMQAKHRSRSRTPARRAARSPIAPKFLAPFGSGTQTPNNKAVTRRYSTSPLPGTSTPTSSSMKDAPRAWGEITANVR